MTKPLYEIGDAEILELLKSRGQLMTYVARNWLSTGRPGLKTAYVRRRLAQLEKKGLVVRTDGHPYAIMIGWKVAQ